MNNRILNNQESIVAKKRYEQEMKIARRRERQERFLAAKMAQAREQERLNRMNDQTQYDAESISTYGSLGYTIMSYIDTVIARAAHFITALSTVANAFPILMSVVTIFFGLYEIATALTISNETIATRIVTLVSRPLSMALGISMYALPTFIPYLILGIIAVSMARSVCSIGIDAYNYFFGEGKNEKIQLAEIEANLCSRLSMNDITLLERYRKTGMFSGDSTQYQLCKQDEAFAALAKKNVERIHTIYDHTFNLVAGGFILLGYILLMNPTTLPVGAALIALTATVSLVYVLDKHGYNPFKIIAKKAFGYEAAKEDHHIPLDYLKKQITPLSSNTIAYGITGKPSIDAVTAAHTTPVHIEPMTSTQPNQVVSVPRVSNPVALTA